MKYRALFVLALLVILFPSVASAQAPAEIQDVVEGMMDDTEISQWNSVLDDLPAEVRALWGNRDLSSMMEDYALGEQPYLGGALQDGVVNLLRGVLPDMLPVLISLMAVAVLSGFLRSLSDAGMKGLNDITGFVCHCFAIGIAFTCFLSLAALARDTIAQMATFIELAFPVLLTLLTAAGGIASSGIFQPAMVLLSNGVVLILQNVVLPIVLAGGVLGVLNNMTGRVQLGQMFQLSKTLAKWIIGLITTLYFGITSLQGMTAAAFDGISIRTAKFAVDKLVPIVGGMVSGTMDTVLGCAMLVKNAAGVAAIVMAFSVVLMPLLRIAAGMLAFRLAAALAEPIGEVGIPKMLSALADVLTYLFAATVTLCVMFMITVGLIMGTGNIALSGG